MSNCRWFLAPSLEEPTSFNLRDPRPRVRLSCVWLHSPEERWATVPVPMEATLDASIVGQLGMFGVDILTQQKKSWGFLTRKNGFNKMRI